MNFDMRKRLLEYDDVVNKHRQTVYQKRVKLMKDFRDSRKGQIELEEITKKEIRRLVEFHTKGELSAEWNLEEIAEEAKAIFSTDEDINLNLVKLSSQKEASRREGMMKYLNAIGDGIYQEKTRTIGEERWRDVGKLVLLKMLDNLWVQHLDNMDFLKQSVGLRAYGQRDPLVEYRTEGHRMFQDFMLRWESIVTRTIFKIKLKT
jgi:preprotein translocase subunit SecA